MSKKNPFPAIVLLSFLIIGTTLTFLPTSSNSGPSEFVLLPAIYKGSPWPNACYAPGTQNYRDSLPEPVVPNIVRSRGTVITVTTTADDVNGNVSSVQGLLNDPGPDGLALREAMTAANNDPGEYTITFAPDLKDSTIHLGGSGNDNLPSLLAGSVLINGDIDDDDLPDITLIDAGTNPYPFGLRILSSNHAINGLRLEGFFNAVTIGPSAADSLYENISITNLVIRDVGSGILVAAHYGHPSTWQSNNDWRNISIIGNDIEAGLNGINAALSYTIGDTLEDLIIANNVVDIFQEVDSASFGIAVAPGHEIGSTNNVVTNTLITDNIVEGSADIAIFVVSGAVAAQDNTISGIQIVRNQITISHDHDHSGWTPEGYLGIMLTTGDYASTHNYPDLRPIIYADRNHISDVLIADNIVQGFWGSGIELSGGYGGTQFSEISNVRILGNRLQAIIDNEIIGIGGIKVKGGLGGVRGERPTKYNTTSNVIIQQNEVQIGIDPGVPTHRQNASAGITVMGAEVGPTGSNQVNDVWIALNEVESVVPGIHVMGGWTHAVENVVSGVNIYCNSVPKAPLYPEWYEDLRGINFTGGELDAVRNRVENVVLAENLVAGVKNDVSVHENISDDSFDNVVNYIIKPSLP